MENKDLQNQEEENNEFETNTYRNDEAKPNDSAVVTEEEDRTASLTEDETIVIEKEETDSLAPNNRPRKVYSGMWGVPEIITVSLALLTLLTLTIIYVFFVLPSQQTLEANRIKRDSLEKKLKTEQAKYEGFTSTESRVAKLITSAADFETRFLKTESLGKSAMYKRLNGLIRAYRLTNTTGPDYVPLEISENERRSGTNEGQSGRTKYQSLFPGVYVTMTVEGSYVNLRGFIREIERSNEFLVVSSIELEPAEDNDGDEENSITVTKVNNQGQKVQVKQKALDRGKTRGKVVSLRLELAAYFQRPAEQRVLTGLPELEDSDNPIEVVQ